MAFRVGGNAAMSTRVKLAITDCLTCQQHDDVAVNLLSVNDRGAKDVCKSFGAKAVSWETKPKERYSAEKLPPLRVFSPIATSEATRRYTF
ncbi:hypothetical protein QR680_017690 [Steinernema hermaphroditum]|uniref:Uncharacterized protein n=1 Tax=Steinernema hermaphroditum TaxID=289476 RepID=A0AA39HFH8_9BILA|nr:hypothetical protein QR680_017690 [Steinernema hermaphroditum]